MQEKTEVGGSQIWAAAIGDEYSLQSLVLKSERGDERICKRLPASLGF